MIREIVGWTVVIFLGAFMLAMIQTGTPLGEAIQSVAPVAIGLFLGGLIVMLWFVMWLQKRRQGG